MLFTKIYHNFRCTWNFSLFMCICIKTQNIGTQKVFSKKVFRKLWCWNREKVEKFSMQRLQKTFLQSKQHVMKKLTNGRALHFHHQSFCILVVIKLNLSHLPSSPLILVISNITVINIQIDWAFSRPRRFFYQSTKSSTLRVNQVQSKSFYHNLVYCLFEYFFD